MSFPRSHVSGLHFRFETGARYGIYIALFAGIAEVVAALMATRVSGEDA